MSVTARRAGLLEQRVRIAVPFLLNMVTINLQPHQPACSCGHFSNSWTVEAWKMQVDFMETGKSKGIKGLCKEVIIHSAEPPNPNSRLIFAFSLTAPVAGTPGKSSPAPSPPPAPLSPLPLLPAPLSGCPECTTNPDGGRARKE